MQWRHVPRYTEERHYLRDYNVNPKVDTPPFAATAVPLQLYQSRSEKTLVLNGTRIQNIYLLHSKTEYLVTIIKHWNALNISDALSVHPQLTPCYKSYYKSSSVCLFVCLFVPYLLRGPLTDLRQTWWVYAGGPRNCPWGVLFRKRQRVDGSTGHFRFPLYYIYASLTPHSCKRRLCCYCI